MGNSIDYTFWRVFVDTDLMQIFGAKVDSVHKYPDVANRPKLEPISFSLPLCTIPLDNKTNDIQNTTNELLRYSLFQSTSDKTSKLKVDKLRLVLFQKYTEKGLLDSALDICQKINNLNVLKKTIKIAQYFEQNTLANKVKEMIRNKEANKQSQINMQQVQSKSEKTSQKSINNETKNTPSFSSSKAPQFGQLKKKFTPSDPFDRKDNADNCVSKVNDTASGSKRKNPFGSAKPNKKSN